MKKNIYSIFFFLLSLVISIIAFLPSCSDDFLTQEPVGAYSESNIANKDGVNKLLIGAYSSLNGSTIKGHYYVLTSPGGSVLGNIHGGELMKGSNAGDLPWLLEFSQHNVTTGNGGIDAFWTYEYDAIYRCNQVLKTLAEVEEFSEAERLQITAEARFLRGHYYFLLKRAFKNIPWIDETTEDVRVSNVDDVGNYLDIWPQITADFEFARKNLPVTQKDLGRPNKWAAEAYYAKVMIYRACENEYDSGYSEALTVLNDVITNGVTSKGVKYALYSNYYYNFSCPYENGSECVFAVQHSANDGSITNVGSGGENGNCETYYASLMVADGPGFGLGAGFFQPSIWFADHFRVDENGLPFLDMYETNPNGLKTDDGLESTDPFTPDIVPVDPRLDWSLGRRGIPMLDYGIMPGKGWVRAQDFNGPYITKKLFIKKSENGVYSIKDKVPNALNYNVIRYADVLLMTAECEARVGSLDNARALVNQVRNRMVQNSESPDNWVKLTDGMTNAANYKIGLYPIGGASDPFQSKDGALDAILFERTLELGCEGHRFYDVVRFAKGEEEFNTIVETQKARYGFLNSTAFTETDAYLPIPTNAIDKSQKEGESTLKQNPGY